MFILDKKHRKKFIIILSSILSIFFILLILIIFVYKNFYAIPAYDPSKQMDIMLVSKDNKELETKPSKKKFLTPPVRTNVLILGLDKAENLTDVIMVASFISTTGEINLMSVPRDTYTAISGENLKMLRNANSHAPSIMKLNSVFSYSGKEKGPNILKAVLEEMLGINIDYYIKVNLDAFKKIVDTVGGINFNVPEGGLKYRDPTQNLNINLKGGYQLLDGEAAEGLVRFRKGYATQDLKRVQVQQEFIKEFVQQILNKETLMSNLGGIVVNLIRYVETDFKLSDLPKYISSIDKINTENMKTTTVAGSPKMIGDASYYILDKVKTKEIVDEYFYGNTDPLKKLDENLQVDENTDK